MRIVRLFATCLVLLSTLLSPSFAQEAPSKQFAYFGLEPDIVTNYLGNSNRKLGYVRITIELMLEDVNDLEKADHHSPCYAPPPLKSLADNRKSESNLLLVVKIFDALF